MGFHANASLATYPSIPKRPIPSLQLAFIDIPTKSRQMLHNVFKKSSKRQFTNCKVELSRLYGISIVSLYMDDVKATTR
jgi:hypothetical protein